MDIRHVLEAEFVRYFRDQGGRITPDLLRAASATINFESIEAAIRSSTQSHIRTHPFRPRGQLELETKQIREQHERKLKHLTQIYAARILQISKRRGSITASDALTAQSTMRRVRTPGCDVYPCQK